MAERIEVQVNDLGSSLRLNIMKVEKIAPICYEKVSDLLSQFRVVSVSCSVSSKRRKKLKKN